MKTHPVSIRLAFEVALIEFISNLKVEIQSHLNLPRFRIEIWPLDVFFDRVYTVDPDSPCHT